MFVLGLLDGRHGRMLGRNSANLFGDGGFASVAASFSTPNITITATTTFSLAAGRFGAAISVNGGAATWYDGAGAASSQSLTLSLTDIGAGAGDLICIDVGYSLTDPATTKVYASASGLYITPSIATPTITGLSNPPVVAETATGVNGTTLARYTNATSTGATRSVLWLLDGSSAGDTDNSYTIVGGDVGKTLSFRNTTSDGGTATSAATAAIVSGAATVAFLNANTPTHVAATSFSGSMSVTAGGAQKCAFAVIVVYYTGGGDPSPISSVTYNGVAMTSCGAAVTNTTSHVLGEIYQLVNPDTGSNTLAITGGANTTGIYCNLISFTGVDQTTPVRVGTLNTATGSAISPSLVISSDANDLTITVTNNGGVVINGTNQTSDGIDNGGSKAMGSDHATTAAASVTHTWTYSSADNYLIYGFSIKHA